jgi:hypothetical protein
MMIEGRDQQRCRGGIAQRHQGFSGSAAGMPVGIREPAHERG